MTCVCCILIAGSDRLGPGELAAPAAIADQGPELPDKIGLKQNKGLVAEELRCFSCLLTIHADKSKIKLGE